MKFQRLVLFGFKPDDLAGAAGRALRRELESRADDVCASNDAHDLAAADGLILELGASANRGLFELAPHLRYVGVFGTEKGRVDLEAAAACGITVENVPGYSTDSVAEFVFATLLERLRFLEMERIRAKKRDFSDGAGGSTLAGKRLGVIGLGRIGRRVAELARLGFGASVGYFSRTRRPDLESELGIVWQDLKALSAGSDVVAVHLPLSVETAGLLTRDVLSSAKAGAIWIHLCPMEIVDADGLDERLGAGDFTFVFDHADELDPGLLERLTRHARAFPYPPVACNTDEARASKLRIFLEKMDAFLATPSR